MYYIACSCPRLIGAPQTAGSLEGPHDHDALQHGRTCWYRRFIMPPLVGGRPLKWMAGRTGRWKGVAVLGADVM